MNWNEDGMSSYLIGFYASLTDTGRVRFLDLYLRFHALAKLEWKRTGRLLTEASMENLFEQHAERLEQIDPQRILTRKERRLLREEFFSVVTH